MEIKNFLQLKGQHAYNSVAWFSSKVIGSNHLFIAASKAPTKRDFLNDSLSA